MDIKNNKIFSQLKETLENVRNEKKDLFYAWTATVQQSYSDQMLADGDLHVHQDRLVLDLTFSYGVYTRHDGKMGQVMRSLDQNADFRLQIESAINDSLLVSNDVWDFPGPEKYDAVETADKDLLEKPSFVKESIIRQIEESKSELDGVRLNSMELYINRSRRLQETSHGVVMDKESADLYFEASMEKLPGPNTQEVHRYKKCLSMQELDIKNFLISMKEETLSLDKAVMPATSQEAVFLVDAEVISEFLYATMDHLYSDALYNKEPFLPPGENVFTESKAAGSDRIHLTMDPYIPLMVLSTPFNFEGLKSRKATVIENDVVKEEITSNRMAQYLKKDPNPVTGNFLLASGSRSKEELLAGVPECIEILSFSSLLINHRTLTWSSEIKLAKLYKNGKFSAMIKGGVASGSIRLHYSDFLLSNDVITRNAVGDSYHPSIGYRGPSFMLIKKGVKIAGE